MSGFERLILLLVSSRHRRTHRSVKVSLETGADGDGELAMAVMPANRKVILQDLRDVTGSEPVRFTPEHKFKSRFPDYEIGAMPPFGNLYGMEVFAALSLVDSNQIAFNAGSHEEIIKMAYADFERLVKPNVVSFTT